MVHITLVETIVVHITLIETKVVHITLIETIVVRVSASILQNPMLASPVVPFGLFWVQGSRIK